MSMTICISAINSNGKYAVVASDSMITNYHLAIEFEHPTTKMTQLSDHCIALTAGDALVHTEVFNSAKRKIGQLSDTSIEAIVGEVVSSYHEIREKHIKERFLKPRGFESIRDFIDNQHKLHNDIAWSIQDTIGQYDLGLEILIAGVNDGIAHLYGINNPGTSNCFDAIGFYAIGSGLPHALNSLIARGCHTGHSLEDCLMNVYESKRMAEKAPGVGSNVTNIAILNENGIFQLSAKEIETLNKAYEKKQKRGLDSHKEIEELIKNKKMEK